MKAVALDAMGVIYTVGDDLRSILIPFLWEHGCVLSEEEIAVVYRTCYRQGAPATAFWDAMACGEDVNQLEEQFLALYELNPGVLRFLEKMKLDGIPVYMLSNDVNEWSAKRRTIHQLDSYFTGFVVSGEVRAHKPNPEIYQLLVEMLSCPPGDCLFVDDRAPNLRAAVQAGLATVQFSSETSDEFPSVPGFDELTQYVLARRQSIGP